MISSKSLIHLMCNLAHCVLIVATFPRYIARKVTLKDEGDTIGVLVQTGQVRDLHFFHFSFKSELNIS
jgi:hypothetical protein